MLCDGQASSTVWMLAQSCPWRATLHLTCLLCCAVPADVPDLVENFDEAAK
jgi:hypothetical protein